MTTLTRLLPLLLCLFMLNCASRISTKTMADQNPFDYRTFAYVATSGMDASALNRAIDEDVDEATINQMTKRMNSLGFALDKTNPDLIVVISNSNTIKSNLKKDGSNSAATKSSSSAMSPYSGSTSASASNATRYSITESRPTTRPFKNGNMIIELFNAETKALVWVGTAKNFKTDIAGQNLTVMMVDEIFDKFP